MNDQWYKHLIGARTIKTGIAIFLTAVFCMALDLTPIYAILTAVVTIEPTAKASLIKGYRRLPATVIGAGFAVLFTYLFGDQYKTQIASWYECCCTNIFSYDSRYS